MNNKLDQYVREVNRLLPCSAKEKKRCIAELEADAYAYLEQNPDASLEELYEAVGSPHAIAQAFMAHLGPEQLSHRMSIKRKIVIGVISIAAILAIVVGSLVAVTAYKRHNFYNGYFVDTVDELPSNDEPNQVPLTEH